MSVQIQSLIFQTAAIFIAVTVHEYSKGLASARQGDTLPRSEGRLTLNPIKHAEPIGFLFLFIFQYGWSRPLETSSVHYKDWKKGVIMTYAAAILCNFIVGLAFGFGYRAAALGYDLLAASGESTLTTSIIHSLAALFMFTARYNISLGLINVIPAPPMAGAKLLAALLSANNRIKYTSYEKVFQIIMVVLLVTGILSRALDPIRKAILGF